MANRSDPTGWMWAQACELIDEADRLHRHFFHLTTSQRTLAAWQPPVDVFEDERQVLVVVAMPGVAASGVEVILEASVLLVRGVRQCRYRARATACASLKFRTAV